MEQESWTIEQTFFVPLSALDAANYIMLGSVLKIADHDEVPAEHHHFLDDLRDIIAIHKQTFRIIVAEDGSVRKSTSMEVAQHMSDLLQRLDESGLQLCFRMWSLPFEEIFEEVEVPNILESKNDSNCLGDSTDEDADHTSEEAGAHHVDFQRRTPFGCGAVVAFMIVPRNLPMKISENDNGHGEVCICQLPDWNSLKDELAEI